MDSSSRIFVAFRGSAFYTVDVALSGNDIVGDYFFRIDYARRGVPAPRYGIFELLFVYRHVAAVFANSGSGFLRTTSRPRIGTIEY
ncbi:hypothetical protein [Mycolicibacterium sp. F2034L]|uniref:hypothetical protein n=1 Tax=Mycolicibacterium sp. F2034L TaxID=2926422 RepID=UPI001FF345E9|nr:hypothetical protein [Mycolicibacterium sp. F2034L]MCK0174362.1 hypothetical protein [Mycolicibacterium sp. F2034L]